MPKTLPLEKEKLLRIFSWNLTLGYADIA